MNSREIFESVAKVAAGGWKILRLYGVTDAGKCTCGKSDCVQSAGKHPMGAAWQHQATADEEQIWRWLESIQEDRDHTRINLGVRLGPSSGVIDIEYDTPEAEAALKEYGLDRIDTPAYSSGRGIHRIFQYEDWMPAAGTVHVRGIEVRIGGGTAAAHSVIPPSLHRSGRHYEWLPDRAPWDISPATVPPHFRDAILNESKQKGSGKVAQACQVLRSGKRVGEGGRHAFLVGAASRNAARIRRFTPEEKQELSQIMLALNAAFCDPPKSVDEVLKIVNDQFAHYQESQSAKSTKYTFEKYGLEWNPEERCYEAGQWRLTVIQGDPKEYRLTIPNKESERPPHEIIISPDDYQKSSKVALAILAQTGTVNVLDPPSRWSTIWSGDSFRDSEGNWITIRGLQSKLMDDPDIERPPPEHFVVSSHAAVILEYLEEQGKAQSGDATLDRRARDGEQPKWILEEKTGEWGLYFNWRDIIPAALRRRSIRKELTVREERRLHAAILKVCGEKSFECRKGVLTETGKRKAFTILRDRHIEALRQISEGEWSDE
jgi:hypothetical protein